MNINIPFSESLTDKGSDEYLSKKKQLLDELKDAFERVANVEEDADLQFDDIDVDFEEIR